ncbi:MAG: hypothetical protein K1Y36_26115 [Blastocatellia bacterium]|nr:hypothetical protein [Blastocatellia bacterium]
MIIIYGTKIRKHSVGWVSEFCPICGEITKGNLTELIVYDHVYFIPTTSGTVIEHRSYCDQCGFGTVSDRNSFIGTKNDRIYALEDLIRETCPDIRAKYAMPLKAEENLKLGLTKTASPAQRFEQIAHPFYLLERDFREFFSGETKLDAYGNTALSVVLLVGILGSALCFYFFNNAELFFWTGTGTLLLTALSFCVFLYFHATTKRRFVAGAIVPILHKRLRIVQPTREELESCLEALKSRRIQIASHLTIDQLLGR